MMSAPQDNNVELEPLSLVRAHEEERTLIASDIHDGIIQYLVAAKMHFESSRGDVADMSSNAAAQFANGLRLLGSAIAEARATMNRVFPPVLKDEGVVAGLEHLIAAHRLSHPTVVTLRHDLTTSVSELSAVTVYRIVQQSLANIGQHSGASHAHVALDTSGDQIRLTISDTGIGFVPDDIGKSSTGIAGMRLRAQALGGTLEIESSDDGTILTVMLPVQDALAAEKRRRELAEQQRDIVQRRLGLALRATSDAIWDIDLVSGRVVWNDGYNHLFGERPAETDDSWKWWIDHLHDDDRQRVVASIEAAASSSPDYGDRWTEEYRFRRAGGAFVAIRDQAFIARDASGTPIRMVGCMIEIA